MIQETEIPVLRGKIVYAERGENGKWCVEFAVKCPGCGREHYHGDTLDGKTPIKTLRSSHCGSGPLVGASYYITVDPADIPKLNKRKAKSKRRKTKK